MTGSGDGKTEAAGGPARHVPVLLAEVCEALNAGRGGLYVDGTFGAGGYTRGILTSHAGTSVIGIDRDPNAIRRGDMLVRQARGRVRLVEGRFGNLDTLVSEWAPVDGVVLDIGVSSMQIDEAERGFSFRFDGPLDMRMEQAGQSAADIVNNAAEAELADIIFHYGEERRSRAIARAIIEARRKAPITTTKHLADLVAAHVWAEPGGMHPATRVFQALRIAVNDELGELVRALHAAERILKPGGRLAVVTFHSLEDRIVKQFFTARTGRTPAGSRHMPIVVAPTATFEAPAKGPITPGEKELAANPRARSAKLRYAIRTDAEAQPMLDSLTLLAELPDRSRSKGDRR